MKQKRILLVVSGIVLIIASAVALFMLNSSENTPTATTAELSGEALLQKQLDTSCDVFDQETARTLLGPEAVKIETANEPENAYSEDIATSRCSYTYKTYDEATPPETQKVATLTIRTPRTDKGEQANRAVFQGRTLPPTDEMVQNYGETAYWSGEFRQLHILADDEWYTLEYGPFLPEGRNLGDTLKFADIIKDDLSL